MQRTKIDRQLIDLDNAKKVKTRTTVSRFVQSGAVNPGFTKGGKCKQWKPMLKCSRHKRFTYRQWSAYTPFPPRTNQSGTSLS